MNPLISIKQDTGQQTQKSDLSDCYRGPKLSVRCRTRSPTRASSCHAAAAFARAVARLLSACQHLRPPSVPASAIVDDIAALCQYFHSTLSRFLLVLCDRDTQGTTINQEEAGLVCDRSAFSATQREPVEVIAWLGRPTLCLGAAHPGWLS